MPRQIGSLLFVVFLIMVLNVAIEIIHNLYSGEYSLLLLLDSFWHFGLETIIFFIVGEIVTSKISKRFPQFLSLSEAMQGITCILKDARHFIFRNTNTYVSECDIETMENKSKIAPIDFCETKEVKDYVRFYTSNPDLVTYATEYPIANVTDKHKMKSIIRNQELYRNKYGIVYKSKFNSMVVDPIEDDKCGFFLMNV